MRTRGFSLIELLVVVAIIGVMMAMTLAGLSKAKGAADRVSKAEGMRQHAMGEMADNANLAKPVTEKPSRTECRAAFHQWLEEPEENGNPLATEMLYVVRTEAEFAAYYHTLINKDNTTPLEYANNMLNAYDPDGNTFLLPPLGDPLYAAERYGRLPMAWEFLSTDMSETNLTSRIINVLYTDGSVKPMRYGSGYPVTRLVAELSHDFKKSL